ncbi:MAG: WbqC family protein [Prevotella sp.]|nr:WbqC family protein [Candidatus Prevotella equi]
MHTTYFGPISWYRLLIENEKLKMENSQFSTFNFQLNSDEFYVKQTTRNHCCIATANGVQKLTVPVTLPTKGIETGASKKLGCPIRDVRISDHGNWRHQHWEALKSAYGMSPFFEYYADDIAPFFEKRWDFLYDYNMEITTKVLELLGPFPTAILRTSNTAASNSLPSEAFREGRGGSLAGSLPYYQTFQLRHGFIPDLSILDLLFNMGPESILILKGAKN